MKTDLPLSDVGQLTSLLTRRRITNPVFSIERDPLEIADAIYAAYRIEVGESFNFDEPTREHILAVARWLSSPKKCGLLLYGSVGNGKTTMMRALGKLIELVTEHEWGVSKRLTLPIVTAEDIADAMRREDEGRYFASLSSMPLLGIDDLGVEPREVLCFGTPRHPLARLLTKRYEARLFTVISTNLSTAQMREQYGDRVYDRLAEMCAVVAFTNKSYRNRKNKNNSQS